VQEKDRNGLSFFFQYNGNDPFAKCVRTWGDAGLFDRLIYYDEPNRKTFVVDSHGAATVYQRDDLGQIIAETDPMQKVKRYVYDPDSGQLSTFIDERGRESRSEFDAHGNVVAKVKPDGTCVAFEYDQDQLVRMVDEIGGVWLFQYTRDGRLRRATDPIGVATTWTWKRGLLHEIRDAMGAVTAFEYDGTKNLCKVKHPSGGEERFEHDACGRWTKFWDAMGAMTKCKRDALGRVVEVFEPDGNHRRLKYDAEGNVIEAIDLARHIVFGYGGFHKLVRREEAGQTITMKYDTEDRMTAIVNEAGEEHTFMRDVCGRVIAERHFDNRRITRYLLDEAGQIHKVIRPSGKQIRIERDAMDRIVAVHSPNGKTERYEYRADGALVEAINDTVHVKMERDALGRVVREEQGPHAIDKRYDLCGRTMEVRSSFGFDAAFVRDRAGAIEAYSMGTGVDRFRVFVDRDAAGLEKQRRLPGGIAVHTRRDPMGRVKETSFLDATEELRRIRYVWARGDLLKERDDTRRGKTLFFHDRRARLMGSEEPCLGVLWRRPTESGNIQLALETDPQVYGANGALLKSDGVEYRYDFDGNRTMAVYPDHTREVYTWDDFGRLIEVRGRDNASVRFAYDALGRRIRKTSTKDECVFVWDGDVVLHELSLHAAPSPRVA
jgi:YD repeat-containing protein